MAEGQPVRAESEAGAGRGEGARSKLSDRAKLKIHLTWQQFDDAVELIAKRTQGVGSVYGVPRGGLVLAVAISHKLDVPLVDAIRSDTLVVDDVVETGMTMFALTQGAKFWAWVNKSKHKVSSAMVLPSDAWIVFPWEDAARAARDAEAYYASRK